MSITAGIIVLIILGNWRRQEQQADQARGSVYIGRGLCMRVEPEPLPGPPVTWPTFRRCSRQRKV